MRIFFENKSFVFCTADQVGGRNNIVVRHDEAVAPAKLLEKVGNNNTLCVVSDLPSENFDIFCRQFPIVEAAGGLVENDRGEILMITRKGWRDLPKGHIEQGETAEAAARREVCEETGLQEVDIVAPLCTTAHFHNAYGHWEIKRTAWFLMHAGGDSPELAPQADEQISAAEWLCGRRLWQAADSSYGTIKEVFEKFLEKKIK